MKRQFQHEDHSRQDKAKKADYQDAFGDPFDPGCSYDPTIRLKDIVHRSASQKYCVQLRINIARFIESTLRGAEHEIDGCRFRFRMSPKQFAMANRLSVNAAARRLRQITEEAQERLDMTKRSALRAEFEAATVEGRPAGSNVMLQISFKNFLHTVKPIDWNRIHTKIRLNAVTAA
jgi:hypothetical protein